MPHFSPLHLFWIFISIGFALWSASFYRRPMEDFWRTMYRWGLFSLALGSEIVWFGVRAWELDIPVRYSLPLHISDITLMLVLLGLATQNSFIRAIAFFAGFPSAWMAIVLPSITETGHLFHWAILKFYITHIAIFGGALYGTLGSRYFPGLRRAAQTMGLTFVYGISLVPLNRQLGTNYFFTQKPPITTIPWLLELSQPVYLFCATVLFASLYFCCWVFLRLMKKLIRL